MSRRLGWEVARDRPGGEAHGEAVPDALRAAGLTAVGAQRRTRHAHRRVTWPPPTSYTRLPPKSRDCNDDSRPPQTAAGCSPCRRSRVALREATSHDLVFAVVGHAGAGASHVALSLIAGLKSSPYVAEYVKVSSLIADAALGLNTDQFANVGSASRLERARALQDAGNWLRKNQYPSFTAALAIKRLHDIRASRDPERPIAFVLDSLKNPEEVDALRKVYGRSLLSRQRRLRSTFARSDWIWGPGEEARPTARSLR